MHNIYSSQNKNIRSNFYTLYDESDRKIHHFLRTRNLFYDVTNCYEKILTHSKKFPYLNILTNSRTPYRYPNGLIPGAKRVSADRVADLLVQEEDRQDRLDRVEVALRDYIEFKQSQSQSESESQSQSRKPNKKGKLRLQKKEAIN